MVDIEINGRVAKAEISVFDAIHAELLGEKELRAEKFMRNHGVDKFGNPVKKDKTPKDRKADKIRRIRKLYGDVFEDGRYWYWERGKEGQKKIPDKDAEILRNMKDAESDRIMREDYEDEQRQAYWDEIGYVPERVGKTTLQKAIDRLWNKLAEMRKPYEAKGYFCMTENYAEDRHAYELKLYPIAYYYTLWKMQDLQNWQEVLTNAKFGIDDGYDAEEREYIKNRAEKVLDEMQKGECY